MPSNDILDNTEVSLDSNKDKIRADYVYVEFEVERDAEQLGIRYEVVYVDLVNLEGFMMDKARQASLRDISMVISIGSKDVMEQGINSQRELLICKLLPWLNLAA